MTVVEMTGQHCQRPDKSGMLEAGYLIGIIDVHNLHNDACVFHVV